MNKSRARMIILLRTEFRTSMIKYSQITQSLSHPWQGGLKMFIEFLNENFANVYQMLEEKIRF